MADLTAVDWDCEDALVRLITGETIEVQYGDTILVDLDEPDEGGIVPIVSCDTIRPRHDYEDRIIGLKIG